MRHAGLTRCPWCGARNYTIDLWCSRCSHYLDWAPAGRRYHRGLAVLSAFSAVLGVSLLLVMPAAGWYGGARPTVSLNFSNFRLPLQANSGHAEATGSPDAAPTPDSTSPAIGQAAVPPPAQPEPALRATIGAPTDAVSRFYQAISAHHFDVAASLWTEQLQQRNPPTVFIDERFSGTDRIDVGSERLLAIGSGTAIVYVDVNELIGGLNRRWIGTWQVVDTASGWLLNNSDLQPGA